MMGRGCFLCSFLLLLLSGGSWSSAAREPNTDGFSVVEFLTQMGASLPSESGGRQANDSLPPCPMEVRCAVEEGRVVSLEASNLGLRGSMPVNTIGRLGKLRFLDLSGNHITGVASDFWGLGSSLQRLDLSRNSITGSLPNDMGNLGRLEILDLSYNRFSGSIPVQIGSLQSLTRLNLSNNGFVGSIPKEILQCRSLVNLDLSSNGLSGTLPNDFSSLRNLESLNLAGNGISGRLPDFSGLLFFRHLNLSNNGFLDSVSSALHSPLQSVDLSGNQFTGHISQVYTASHLWPNLTYLDLSSNQISGLLFPDLGEALSLRHLNLSNNRFSHQSFPRIGELSNLEYLGLSRIGLVGKIPEEVGKLANLRVLDLSLNHLEGQVPNLNANGMEVLDLSSNNLTGEIPLDLQRKLLQMSRFNFSYNNLTFCSSSFPIDKLKSAFIGSRNDCPIAADPDRIGAGGGSHRRRDLALAIALSAFFLLMGVTCLVLIVRRPKGLLVTKQIPGKEDPTLSGPFSFETDSTTWVADVKDATSVSVVIFEKPLLNLTFADLLAATSNFDRGTLLAEGKFGPVYRGILPGGFNVAIKVLAHGSMLTDEQAAMEFERLGRIKHPNMVPLTGYCLAGDQRIAVYDYMENGNLQNLLHDLPLGIQTTEDWTNDTWEDDNDGVHSITSEGQTTWKFRHRIALGTARALAYLHHGCFPQIVHKDVKASSVFLDSAFEPRLSDFGLAKIVGSKFEDEIARISPGYTPPELTGPDACPATFKSDVYAFGVILFELITGKKPIGDEYTEGKDANLVSWVRNLVKKKQASDAIDPKIYETGVVKHMEEALRIGYLCTADAPSKRPTMQQIVGLLKDIEPAVADQWIRG